jgi:antitoxin component of MazEF toxin-antitoxin module
MPTIRKVIPCGPNSQGMTFPATWLKCAAMEKGKKIEAVIVEESNGSLIVRPYYEK